MLHNLALAHRSTTTHFKFLKRFKIENKFLIFNLTSFYIINFLKGKIQIEFYWKIKIVRNVNYYKKIIQEELFVSMRERATENPWRILNGYPICKKYVFFVLELNLKDI